MPLILNVPYEERDDAKQRGALWDAQRKKWYVKNKKNYSDFIKWLPKETYYIICDYLYIIEGVQLCFKCGKETKVIGYGVENYFEFEVENECSSFIYEEDEIRITSHIEPLPNELFKYLQVNYNYKIKYSKMKNDSYLANCCTNCDVLQGDFFLFDEVDSPFFIHNEETASKLTLYRVKLDFDLPVSNVEMSWSTNDYLIKEHGKFIDLNIKLT